MNKTQILILAPLCLTLSSCKQMTLTGETNFTDEQIHFIYSNVEDYTSTLTKNTNITVATPYNSVVSVSKNSKRAVDFYFFDTHLEAQNYGEKIQMNFIDWIKNIFNGRGIELTVTYNNITMQLEDFSFLDELKNASKNNEEI